MCGIAALFAYGKGAPPIAPDGLARIQRAMKRRGPDGEGLWIESSGRLGLAHRRLSIIDLSAAAAQPMASADGRLAVVFNGEIYNYREIRDDLAARGRRLATASDTEVLLHLYDLEGMGMLERLRGMFAFALWDKSKRGLLIARDGFGIKPLYYADDGATLRVASQVKALIAGGDIDLAPSPAGQAGFFIWGHVPEPWTMFRSISALPAGHSLWIDDSGVGQPRPFFDIAQELEAGERTALPMAADELREAMLESVRHHLVADVPVGAFLSAGIDSAAVVALASETAGGDLRTLTLAFEEYRGTALDEAPLAEKVAERYATHHQTRRIDAADFQGAYAHLLAAMDQPSIDGVNTYFVSKAAAAAGLKVALSGLGGDELFGGYSDFRDIPRMVAALSPFRVLPGFGRAFRLVSAPLLRRFTSTKYASLFELGTSYADAYLLRRSLFLPWELPTVMDADLAAEGWRELDAAGVLRRAMGDVASARLKVSALEMSHYMRSQLLRDADWAGMAHSLEIRVPLVDTFLLRRLAPMLAGPRPPGKQDLALTPKKPLPTEILRRPKTGFHVPVREWLLRDATASPGERGLRAWARRIAAECYG